MRKNYSGRIVEINGTLKKLYKGCPKPSGWFAGQIMDKFSYYYKVDGTYPYNVADLRVGVQLTVTAKEYTGDYGKSFEIVSVTSVPTKEGVLKTLARTKGIGVGKVRLAKLDAMFHNDLYDRIMNEDKTLLKCGINETQIHLMKLSLMDKKSVMTMKLLKIIPSLPTSVIDKILSNNESANGSIDQETFDRFLQNFSKILQQNPYLLPRKYDFISFSLADEIALDRGVRPDSYDRIYCAMLYSLHTDFENNVCLNLTDDLMNLCKSTCQLLNRNKDVSIQLSTDFLSERVHDILFNGRIDFSKDIIIQNNCLYELVKYYTEDRLAALIACMTKRGPVKHISEDFIRKAIIDYEIKDDKQLDAQQKKAVITALTNGFSVITGGPGRGKSSVAKCILFVWEAFMKSQYYYKTPILLAPTGKASQRLKEATGHEAYTVAKFNVEKQTIIYKSKLNNSDLSVFPLWHEFYGENVLGLDFNKINYSYMKDSCIDELNNLKENLVIIDEATMLGLSTIYKNLFFLHNSQVIVMGDVDQLPSIEYGQFFRDLCESSCIPVVKLLKNYRSAGNIIDGADDINDGKNVEALNFTSNDMFKFYPFNNDVNSGTLCSDFISQKYCDYVMQQNGKTLVENEKNICILTPMHKSSTGAEALNISIQSKVNPSGRRCEDFAYKKNDVDIIPKVGDRIVWLINDYSMEWEKCVGQQEVSNGVFNGDCGRISDYIYDNILEEMCLEIIFDDDRKIILSKSNYTQGVFELGYALTIHKAQGSEYDSVIVSVQAEMLYTKGDFASRNLIYTAITRAKNSCIMAGSVAAMNKCIRTPVKRRLSNFKEKLEIACESII